MKNKYDINNPDDVLHCVTEMQKLNDSLFDMELEFQGEVPKPYPDGYSDVDMIIFYHGNAMGQLIESLSSHDPMPPSQEILDLQKEPEGGFNAPPKCDKCNDTHIMATDWITCQYCADAAPCEPSTIDKSVCGKQNPDSLYTKDEIVALRKMVGDLCDELSDARGKIMLHATVPIPADLIEACSYYEALIIQARAAVKKKL